MEKQDIIYCIKHSGITKQRLKNEIGLHIRPRAEFAVNDPGGVFYGQGKTVDEITFYWFKNWLHPMLKHRTPAPNPSRYNMNDEDERKEFQELLFRHTYENGQQNFDYTMETIMEYIESED